MKLKHSVRLLGIQPECVLGLLVAETVYRHHGEELTVTSLTDGRHIAKSKHYRGFAFDLRIRDVPASKHQHITSELKDALGTDWDVVLEQDHIHAEFDPAYKHGPG